MKVNQVNTGQPTLEEATNKIDSVINSDSFKECAQKDKSSFTRVRKLPLSTMIYQMLNMMKQSTQVSLDRFFELANKDSVSVTQQAFSKARQKLRWEAICFLNEDLVKFTYEYGYKTWLGFRVSAMDGSKMQMPPDEVIMKYFGTTGRGNTAPTGQASHLFDVLNGFIIDARIGPMANGERELALEHLDFLKNMPSFNKELVLLDRGYPSFDLIENFNSRGISFLMRLKSKFNIEIDKLPLGSHSFFLVQGDKKIKIRVVKFKLSSGEIETLISSLYDESITVDDFKELYFKRWRIETHYGNLKIKLEMENFSSRKINGIYQDYYMAFYHYNLITIAIRQAQPIIEEMGRTKNNKYKYKANFNYCVGTFKDRFIKAVLENNPIERARLFNEIIRLIASGKIPVREGRSIPRNANSRRCRHPHNHKSNC